MPLDSRRRVSPVLAAVTAIAAAVAIGLGIYSISLNGKLDDSRSALTAQESATAVLADPDATTVALQSGSGRVVVDPGGSAVLVVDDLPAAPPGKTYQAWVVEGKEAPASAGTFDTTDKRAIVPLPTPVPDGAVIGVTLESAGGAELADAADGRGVRSGLSRARSGTPHPAAARSVTRRRTGLPIRTVHLFA